MQPAIAIKSIGIPVFPTMTPERKETVGVASDAIDEYTVLTRAI